MTLLERHNKKDPISREHNSGLSAYLKVQEYDSIVHLLFNKRT